MTILIGPNFATELAAAGISGDGIAWGSDGDIQFAETVPQATRDAVAAVLDAHDPAKQTVPSRVSMRQARLALLQAGLLGDVDAAVVAAGGAAQIEWEYAQEVRRNAPLVASIATAANLTDAQLDDLFRLAVTFDY